MVPCRRILASTTLALALAGAASASDGVLEINQACAERGCFAGDGPGFPVTINRDQPASYRLTSALVVEDVNLVGIEIQDDHVTLDLNGFAVTGPTSCTGFGATLQCTPIGAGVGVSAVPNTRTGIAVTHGVVRGMGSSGIALGPESRVEGVLAVGNGGQGISVGPRSHVAGCRVMRNRLAGVSAASSTLQDSEVSGNLQEGVIAIDGSVVSGNVIRGNGASAISTTGFFSTGGTLIVDNAMTANGGGAFLHAGDGYARNTFRGNGAGAQVSGGVALGPNLCGSAACP